MSMTITFYTVPNEMIKSFLANKSSIADIAKYVDSHYEYMDEMDDNNPSDEHLRSEDFYYYPTFQMLEETYDAAFKDQGIPSIVGNPIIDVDEDEELGIYVGFSAGILSFEDIVIIKNKLDELSFENLWQKAFGKDSLENPTKAADNFTTVYEEDDLAEELPALKEYYEELLIYFKKVIEISKENPQGVFIAIN